MADPEVRRRLRSRVAAMMPEVVADLGRLVAIPSVAKAGYPPEPVRHAAELTAEVLRRSGVADAHLVPVPGGHPAVLGRVPGPPGSPTVLLYAHYDVHPADIGNWRSDPWVLTPGPDGRLYGRGAADDKSGVVMHAATIRAWGGAPPVGITVVVEGEEEADSHLGDVLRQYRAAVACDAVIVADAGGPGTGEPALITGLRGAVACDVRVRTLHRQAHSGRFGGPAPDALIALARILASLHDARGDVAVPGLASGVWPAGGDGLDPGLYRAGAGVLPGVDLIGTGTLADRLWARPSVTALGIDAPRPGAAGNVLIDEAAAMLSMRIPPGSDPARELDLLMAHCHRVAPWHVRVETRPRQMVAPVAIPADTRGARAARQALADAFGRPAVLVGSGGSIQLIGTLREMWPDADLVVWGVEDLAQSRIHATDESVDPAEIERYILAQALLLAYLA
jgi:acetylornithine deacetylase/succinyl-diaminopimelate desuccinylase-like protein